VGTMSPLDFEFVAQTRARFLDSFISWIFLQSVVLKKENMKQNL